jgi:hypothetical protein
VEDAPADDQGQPPGTRLAAIKWKHFGGRVAVGSATVREDWCPRGGNCPPDGKRARVVASKPDYCKDSGKIEYLDVQVHVGKTNWYGWRIDCSP